MPKVKRWQYSNNTIFFKLYESSYIPVLSILSVPMLHLLLSDISHLILWLTISYHSVNLLLMFVPLRWHPRKPNEFLCWSRLALMELQRSLKSSMFSLQLNWLFCHPKKSPQFPFPVLSTMRLMTRSPLWKLTKLQCQYSVKFSSRYCEEIIL